MKSLIFAFLIIICITLVSCMSSTSPDSSVNFSADLNGKHWLPRSKVYGVNDTARKEIWISGTAADSTSMWIFIDSLENKPGTYENSRGVYVAGGYYDHGKFNSHYWYSGELTLTVISSSHATGTFQFKAKRDFPADTVSVTNGKFDVSVFPGLIPL